jgi:tRNA pseudouridine55 synthase
MVNGVLIVNKSSGMTSHDVVNSVRRLFGIRRVGHTGTLDPMVTGVMVMLLGSATRLSQYMLRDEKRYKGTIRLGIETSTYDADGEITAVLPVDIGLDRIISVVTGFVGNYAQTPPMYSAIKVNGQKLYNLARQGKTIERQPRHVSIYHIELLEWCPPDLAVDVVCAAGTYIRSLAHDIGKALGCGAHLLALTRTASHGFTLEESHTLDELNGITQKEKLMRFLLSPRAALGHVFPVNLTPTQVTAVRHGQKIVLTPAEQVTLIQALDDHNNLVAVMIPAGCGYWQPKVVMPAGTEHNQ